MIRSTKLLACLLLLAPALHSHAAEQICRYCAEAHNGLAPLGMDLEGRYHYAPDRQVDVTHIKLDVTPDFERRTVAGTASITAKPISKPVDVLRLDAFNLKVTAVRCDGAEIEDFVSSREELLVSFKTPISLEQSFTLQIDYSAQPVKGLYFRTPEMGYPATDTQIWTQGETHEARHWFPCFDYPNEKSSTEIVCHVPKKITVLSNGKRMGEDIDGNGLKVVRWFQEKPHANYLICLVAGEMKKLEKQHRDVALGFYTQPTLIEHAPNSFEDTEKIMAFFEEEIGVNFPWLKYDQVTIRDFLWGGMENTTLTTLTHNTIFSQDTENLRTTRRLDAHEMAHQWFGDYVTCKDWSHLWLNEGFATFYTHLYEGHKFGRDAMLYGLYRDANGIIGNNDRKPIVYNEYKNATEQFDYRAYPKGSWVLHMLRSQLGEELFRKCIKEYLKEHALTSVVSDDLRQVIERHSGRPMDRFFDQWLYHARHPELKITHKWMPKDKLAKVTVRQTQKVDDKVMLFHIPTKLRFVIDGKIVDRDIEVTAVEEDFYVPLPSKPRVVRFDPEFSILAKIDFKKSDDLLIAQLTQETDTMGRVLAAKALGERKTHDAAEALQKALNDDAFFGVRITAAEALGKHDSDESYEMLTKAWQQEDARVRNVIVRRLTGRYHSSTPKIINTIMESEKNPAIQATAIKSLGRFQGGDSKKKILNALNSQSFRNELADAAIAAIKQQREPSYRKPLLKTLRKNEKRFNSRGFGRGLDALATISSQLEKKDDVRQFLAAHLEHTKSPIQLAAINALGTLGDVKATAALESLTSSPNSSVSKAAESAIAKLRDSKPSAPREVVDLRKQIAELKESSKKLEESLKEIRDQLKAKKPDEPKADEKKAD